MKAFFEPRSIALVGVSPRPDSFTARALGYLRQGNFSGDLFPVNPKHESVGGVKCYPDLESIGQPVELVLCMLPAAQVLAVVGSAAKVGASAVSVFAAGFGESGPDGVLLQQRLAALARRTGVRVLGPNCQGTINFHNGVIASFQAAADHLPAGPGPVAYLGQSGAIGGSLLNLAQERGLGYSLWASTGNQADVTVLELAEYAVEHEPTRVLAMYLEDVSDGYRLLHLLQRAREADKRVVILRTGRSQAGRRASRSHTGALQSNDHPGFDLAAESEGAVVVEDVDAFLDASAVLASNPVAKGPRLGVITTSGAVGILAADLCERYGLRLAALSESTRRRIAEVLPVFAANANPIDVTNQFFTSEAPFLEKPGGSDPLQELVNRLARADEVDIIVLALTMVTGALGEALAHDVSVLERQLDKPLIFLWLAGDELTTAGRSVLRKAAVPTFRSIRGALEAASALVRCGQPNPRPGGGHADSAGLRAALQPFPRTMVQAFPLLDFLGIPHPRSAFAPDAPAAAEAASAFGRTVAIKVQSADLAHKHDAGAVALDVAPANVSVVAERLLSRARTHLGDTSAIDGVLVEEMAPPGVELLVGVTWADSGYPPILTIGLGGIHTEVHRDTVSLLVPATPTEIAAAMQRLRSAPLLAGFRGDASVDVDAIATVATRMGNAVAALEGLVREFEINPLIAHAQGVTAVDAYLLGTEREGKTE